VYTDPGPGVSDAPGRREVGSERLAVTTASTRLVRASRRGPFVSRASVLGVVGDTVVCRAETVDEGADSAVVAVGLFRLASSPT